MQSKSTADAIAGLVARLTSQPQWTNGRSPRIDLPQTASAAEVVDEVFVSASFGKGRVSTHRIIETRSVRIGSDPKPYLAVRVETNIGNMIVLVRYESAAGGSSAGGRWWSRVFDVAVAK